MTRRKREGITQALNYTQSCGPEAAPHGVAYFVRV